MNPIIKSVVISEKSAQAVESSKFVFVVDNSSNKTEVKKFLESQFDVKVLSVNILNLKPKKKRKGKHFYKTSSKKKAIVTVCKDSKLDKLKSLF